MIELPWLVPSVRRFTTKDIFVVFRKLSERFERRRVLSDKCTLFEFLLEMAESMVFGELSSVSHELIMRDSIERIRELGVHILVINMSDLPLVFVGGRFFTVVRSFFFRHRKEVESRMIGLELPLGVRGMTQLSGGLRGRSHVDGGGWVI